jgi:hypothetical protein
MTNGRAWIQNHMLEFAGLHPISRPNVNFGRSALPAYYISEKSDGNVRTYSPRGYDRRRHLQSPQQAAHILDMENEIREDVPLPIPTPVPTSTSTSMNWWPYPPWGQSTVSSTLSSTASSSSPAPASVASIVPPLSTTSSPATTPSAAPSQSLAAVTVTTISVLPSEGSLPSQSKLHVAAGLNATLLYLIPVFIAVGLALGVLSGLLGYRWYLRRLARKSGSENGTRTRGSATFIPGPPYISMRDASQSAGGVQETSVTTVGSPSKYTRHGAPQTSRSWLSAAAWTGTHHGSLRSSIPPSRERESTTRATASSPSRHSSASPPRARSRGTVVPPASFSDEENVSYDPSHYRSIRRSILERLQRKSDRNTSGVSREFSRRTAQTYLSTTSAYSGTHSGDSRAPSAMPPSTPPRRNANTEWVPGSGFRIVEETISNPPSLSTTVDPPLSGLPRRASAWDSGDALRQAVDTHPGERWLAWTRSWTSSPPSTGEDRFTAVPSRRTAHEKKDVEALLRSPPHITSSPLQSTLTFSSLPGGPARPAASRARHCQTRAVAKLVPNAIRGTSNASSIVQGDGHGTPAMRFAARHTALTRVEEILAHSYSSRDLAPPKSPTAFGAVPASLEDIAWAAGIEQRMAAATPADRDGA